MSKRRNPTKRFLERDAALAEDLASLAEREFEVKKHADPKKERHITPPIGAIRDLANTRRARANKAK